jgi:hypothetical protein
VITILPVRSELPDGPRGPVAGALTLAQSFV